MVCNVFVTSRILATKLNLHNIFKHLVLGISIINKAPYCAKASDSKKGMANYIDEY